MNEIEKYRENLKNQGWLTIFKNNNTFFQNCLRKKLLISNFQEWHIDTNTNITRDKNNYEKMRNFDDDTFRNFEEMDVFLKMIEITEEEIEILELY